MFAGCVAGAATLFLADLYLHHKYESTALVNVWGYRGPRLGTATQPRVGVVVVGGSTAFGYGPSWLASFPYLLEQRLNAMGPERFSVVNLAFNNEGAFAMRANLEDYAWLNYRVAILYEGYNDLGDAPNRFVFRRQSAIYRLTGYLPVLPIVLEEKAAAMRGQFRADAATTTFTAGRLQTTTTEALKQAAGTLRSLESQLGKLSASAVKESAAPVIPAEHCPPRWQFYCRGIGDAIAYARQRDVVVIVGTQPFISDRHVEQQRALAAFLQYRFGSDPGVIRTDASKAIDLAQRSDLTFDGMHLTERGNAIIAEHFVEPVLQAARRSTARPQG
jgi:hypothetical protein